MYSSNCTVLLSNFNLELTIKSEWYIWEKLNATNRGGTDLKSHHPHVSEKSFNPFEGTLSYNKKTDIINFTVTNVKYKQLWNFSHIVYNKTIKRGNHRKTEGISILSSTLRNVWKWIEWEVLSISNRTVFPGRTACRSFAFFHLNSREYINPVSALLQKGYGKLHQNKMTSDNIKFAKLYIYKIHFQF